MKIKSIFFVSILLITNIMNCKTFYVNTDSKGNGIPYYIKKGIYRQTTEYSRTYIELNIKIFSNQANNEPLGVLNYAINEQDWTGANISRFKNDLHDAMNEVDSISKLNKKILQALSNNNISTIATGDITRELDFAVLPRELIEKVLQNTFELTTIVDYSTTYYYNVKVPPFGKAETSYKISPDGTMTEASSMVDNTKLADLIPLNEFILDKLMITTSESENAITGTSSGPEDPQQQMQILIKIVAEQKGYKYLLTHDYDIEAGNTILENCKKDVTSDGYCIEPLREENAQSIKVSNINSNNSAKKEDNSKGINFHGSIELPKPE